MPKYGDVVILMSKRFHNVNYCLKSISDSEYQIFLNQQLMVPFSEDVINYLNALSKVLYNDPRLKQFPDVATFAFFCRKANLIQQKNKFINDDILKLGKGTVFHITPSNVPINFAFSLVVGLLAGNTNIVKIPSKQFEQINIIVDSINFLSKEQKYKNISNKIILVKYDRSNIATKYFSLDCDVRIIWGGDETINQIRSNTLKPRANDITFADRYSICAINADRFINEKRPKAIANGFYNDTYLFDQNACTSPHLVIWVGSNNNVKISKKIFWSNLHIIVKNKYQVQSVSAIDKITTFYSQSIEMKNISLQDNSDNLMWRINLSELTNNIDQFRSNSGYFSEYHAQSLNEISKIINNRYQTLSYYGFQKKELTRVINEIKPYGIDRIVPIGKTTDFSLLWDGYNIIDSLTRKVEIL
jgi:hypothetical protein